MCSKGVIWASEYSQGPQIWGPGGPGPPGPPPGSATANMNSVLPHVETSRERSRKSQTPNLILYEHVLGPKMSISA